MQHQGQERHWISGVTWNDVSCLLTHSEAVIVNELVMKDCPSFRLTRTSRVLQREREKPSATMKQSVEVCVCHRGTCPLNR